LKNRPKGLTYHESDRHARVQQAQRASRSRAIAESRRQIDSQADVPEVGFAENVEMDDAFERTTDQPVLRMRLTTNAYVGQFGDSAANATHAWRGNIQGVVNRQHLILPLQNCGGNVVGRGQGQQHAMEQHYAGRVGGRLTWNAQLVAQQRTNALGVIQHYDGGFQSRADWCHCRASCLGGPNARHNLFAGSYSCNTFMLAIEEFLCHNGKSNFSIAIELFYADNAALVRTSSRLAPFYVRYHVSKDGTLSSVDFYIFARCLDFSLADAQAVQAQLKRQLGGGNTTI